MNTKSSGFKIAYLVLGMTVPIAVFFLWMRTGGGCRREQVDQAHDITVEDSFPASDPPSSW